MKINAVVNMAANSLPPCFPDTVRELSIGIEDCPESNILEKLIEICHFLGNVTRMVGYALKVFLYRGTTEAQ